MNFIRAVVSDRTNSERNPPSFYVDSALISKTWLEFNSDDSLWQPFLSSIDPLSTLGDGTIVKELTSFFSCKQVMHLSLS